MTGSRSIFSRWPWLARMAWRDSRGRRLLLLLFTSSVAFGVAAIVSVQSLRVNLERLIDEQTRTLLGADVILQSRLKPDTEAAAFIQNLPGAKVEEWRLRSMVRFPQSGNSRFVEVRALDGPMPFYGSMETEPSSPDAAGRPSPGHAIVEQSLLVEFGLEIGEQLLLGNGSFTIEAALLRMAGESEISGFFAPRIYIGLPDLEATGLVQPGSIIRYRTAIAAEGEILTDLLEAVEQARESRFPEQGIRVETVAQRKERLNRILGNMLDFLNLVSFTALLLGGTGILGAVQVYLGGKRETVAVLRCLGAPAHLGTAVYGIQLGAFALLGALLGAILGIGVQFLVPLFLKDFLPFEIAMRMSPMAVLSGFLYGWGVAVASTLLPLSHVSRVSPLQAIRASVERTRHSWRDPLFLSAIALLLLLLFGFALLQARHLWQALGFIGGLALVGGILFGIGWGLRALLRRMAPKGGAYAYRMALSNLYRPQNRTLLLIVILGMGFLMVNTLLLVRGALLGQIGVDLTLDAPNVVLIDVQYDQKEPLVDKLEALGHPAREVMPIVMMRVSAIKDRPLEEWRSMPDSPVSDWVHTWEFRNTYRDHILDNASLLAGEFVPYHDEGEPFPISLSENVVDDFDVGIGDFITWNVQGIAVRSVVTSIRKVNWQLGRQNFNIVFPLGTIEAAPTVFAVSLQTARRDDTNTVQRELAAEFPNVSLVDLSLVFDSVRTILDKAAFVIKFMAAFTIATGLLVLVGALLGTRYQRVRESVLLRTLGASRGFIRKVLSLEFILLGLVGGFAGLLLSWGLAAALLAFVFKLPVQHPDLSSAVLLAGMIVTTWLAGWMTSRGIATEPPLVVLRREG